MLVFATVSLHAQIKEFGHTCSTDEIELSKVKSMHLGERSATSIVCTGDDHIKYVRVNFHYMQSEESGNPQNFTAVDDGLGGTIAYFDVQSVYEGAYWVKLSNGKSGISKKVIVTRN